MKLSNLIRKSLFVVLECTFVLSGPVRYAYRRNLYRPLEIVDFNLMGDQEDFGLEQNRYNIVDDRRFGGRRLPLLNRGVRDISDVTDRFDEEDADSEDTFSEPTCGELRRMWRIARRIHQHAVETNKIPQELHPFSDFEADRFRAERRFGRGNMGLQRANGLKGFRISKSRPAQNDLLLQEISEEYPLSKASVKGSKEVDPTEGNPVYGTIICSE